MLVILWAAWEDAVVQQLPACDNLSKASIGRIHELLGTNMLPRETSREQTPHPLQKTFPQFQSIWDEDPKLPVAKFSFRFFFF